MNCVNSFTVFGNNRENWLRGCIRTNLRQHVSMYKDWTFWLHSDAAFENTGYSQVINKLSDIGIIRVSIIPNDGEKWSNRKKCLMMLWRLLPIWQGTDYVFCRDLDSILTPRQLKCVRAFISSGKLAHGINDNVCHDIPLMGGMCGYKSKDFIGVFGESLNALINRYNNNNWDNHGADQDFMMNVIWPSIRNNSMIHSLQGPNVRSHLKNTAECDTSDIRQEVLDKGDDFTNYIGAVGNSVDEKEIINFYNEYGDREKCEIITKIEKECGF